MIAGDGVLLRVAALHVRQAEGELEPLGRPLGALVGQLLEPDAQVLRHRRDLVLPDAIDRGAQAVVFAIVHLADRGGEAQLRVAQRVRRQRQQAIGLQSAKRGRLHLVKQVAARQRIHFLERRRRFERGEAIDRRHQELIRARRVALQRGQRIRPRAEALRGQRGACGIGRSHDAVGGIPLSSPAQPARRERSLQLRAQLVQVARAPFDAVRRIPQQRRHRREVVFEVVDGGAWRPAAPARRAWRRPLRTRAPPASMPVECAPRSRARCRARRTTARAGAIRSARRADTTHTGAPMRRRPQASAATVRRRLFAAGSQARCRRPPAGCRAGARPRGCAAGTFARQDRARTRCGTIDRGRRQACRRTRGRACGEAARA